MRSGRLPAAGNQAETPSMADTITAPTAQAPNAELRATGTLDIKDGRTGKSYSVQILEGGGEGDTAIRAMDLRPIKTAPDEFGLMTYDPAFMNTASCKSAITFIDGDKRSEEHTSELQSP